MARFTFEVVSGPWSLLALFEGSLTTLLRVHYGTEDFPLSLKGSILTFWY